MSILISVVMGLLGTLGLVSTTVPESVVLRGAIGTSVDCGTGRCGLFCFDYRAVPCVSQAKLDCPLQTLHANMPDPIYTKEIFYGPSVTFDYWHERWAVWLAVDNSTIVAVLAMMKQSRNDNLPQWCNGMGTAWKDCFWKNYTITSCPDSGLNVGLKPIVAIQVVPDPLNTFGTICPFDVFYQENCSVRCGVAGLGCCSDDRNYYQFD